MARNQGYFWPTTMFLHDLGTRLCLLSLMDTDSTLHTSVQKSIKASHIKVSAYVTAYVRLNT